MARGICKSCYEIDYVLDGLCEICRQYFGIDKNQKRSYLDNCLKHFKETVGDGCLFAYSGGKDSTVALYNLKNRFKLQITAITIDHGWLSEEALKRASDFCDSLQVEHVIIKTEPIKHFIGKYPAEYSVNDFLEFNWCAYCCGYEAAEHIAVICAQKKVKYLVTGSNFFLQAGIKIAPRSILFGIDHSINVSDNQKSLSTIFYNSNHKFHVFNILPTLGYDKTKVLHHIRALKLLFTKQRTNTTDCLLHEIKGALSHRYGNEGLLPPGGSARREYLSDFITREHYLELMILDNQFTLSEANDKYDYATRHILRYKNLIAHG